MRNQVLPNPFKYITYNQPIAIYIFSLFGSIALNKITFEMCGVLYKSRSNKTLGSVLYAIFYFINIEILTELCKNIQNINLILLVYMICVIAIFVVLYKVKYN